MKVKELPEDGATYGADQLGDKVLRRQLPAQAMEPRKWVPCIPESLKEVIRVVHTEGGHMGMGVTVDQLKGKVYFPWMKAEVEDYIRACPTCQEKGQERR